jgi:hypothetical protein
MIYEERARAGLTQLKSLVLFSGKAAAHQCAHKVCHNTLNVIIQVKEMGSGEPGHISQANREKRIGRACCLSNVVAWPLLCYIQDCDAVYGS